MLSYHSKAVLANQLTTNDSLKPETPQNILISEDLKPQYNSEQILSDIFYFISRLPAGVIRLYENIYSVLTRILNI